MITGKRHAWLIIAHNEFCILQRLITALDVPECDFYVHIDKKVKQLPTLKVSKGHLYVLNDRVDVRWGHVSQIETELLLLETARNQGPYKHYHIISGTHLPLKPVEEILRFYESHSSEEILRFWPKDEGDADFKLRRYHFPIWDFKSSNNARRSVCQFTWKCVLKDKKVFGIRHHKQEQFLKSDNWLSLTDAAAKYIVPRKKEILKKYRWSLCGDEYFVATELHLAGNNFRINNCQNLLYVDFVNDSPKTLSLTDYPVLCKTDYLFARKFSENAL